MNLKAFRTHIILFFSVVFWGISFVMTKELFLTEAALTPTVIATMRLAVASLVTFPFLLITRRMEVPKKEDLKFFLLLALCEPVIYCICENNGVNLVSSSVSSIIIAIIPIMVTFAAAIFYRQRVKMNYVIGLLLSILGIGVMMIGPDFSINADPKGVLWLFGAVFIAVVYTMLLVKVVHKYKPFTITAWQNLIGLAMFCIILLFDGGYPHIMALSFSPKMFLLFGILGVCCSTLAYAFYNYGVRDIGPVAGCAYNNAIPVFSLIVAVAIGQEDFTLAKLLGMVIVIVGVFVVQKPEKKKSLPKQN